MDECLHPATPTCYVPARVSDLKYVLCRQGTVMMPIRIGIPLRVGDGLYV